MLYGAPSAHTIQLLNDEELATGLGRFWVSQALTTRIQNCEMIMETSVVGVARNCEDVVNKSSVTFNGWIDQENPPKGWKAATSKKGEVKHVDEYKATLQETDAIFTWDLTEWFAKIKNDGVISIVANIQAVDCIPDIKTVESDKSDICEADDIEADSKDPSLGTINYTTKTLGEESKEVMDDATRALNLTEKEKKNNCDLCGDTSAKNKNLKEHMENHIQGPGSGCSVCNKTFHGKEIMNKHVGYHSGDKPSECRFCEKLFSKAELTRRGTNSKYADSSPADAQSKPEAEVKVEDEATETVDSDEVSKEVSERLDEKQDYSPAVVELRNKFYNFATHFSSFRSFPSLKCVINYPDCLVTDRRSIYDELTVLDYEIADYMMLTSVCLWASM